VEPTPQSELEQQFIVAIRHAQAAGERVKRHNPSRYNQMALTELERAAHWAQDDVTVKGLGTPR
jgi:hypothetical protein